MELDKDAKRVVKQLAEAINSAVEKSPTVRDAIETLREMGFEPNLLLKLEVGLQPIIENHDASPEEAELNLTAEDVRTLQRMKIRF